MLWSHSLPQTDACLLQSVLYWTPSGVCCFTVRDHCSTDSATPDSQKSESITVERLGNNWQLVFPGALSCVDTSFFFLPACAARSCRAFEVNRRRVFCKYVLPYMLYLEEIAAILYSTPQGELPDDFSDDDVSLVSANLNERSLQQGN